MPLKPLDTHPLSEGLTRVENMRRQLGATDEELLADYVEEARDKFREAVRKAEGFNREDLRKLVAREMGFSERLLERLRPEGEL